uniref:Titin-like n=1 Tax=Saccoglossus kowalevskii TaxID=10224 RepID=A0ABM0MSM5_SACKO|nr:PREDICTED: titin-like [Saccoglossus kowalevskii]
MKCKVTGLPRPDVQWFKKKAKVKITARTVIEYTDDGVCMLTLHNLGLDDITTYTCKATNKVGEASTSAELILQVAAKITEGPANMSVKRGHTIPLKCTFRGIPKPDVFWYRGKNEIESTGRYAIEVKETYSILTIEDIQPDDSCEFSMEVENEHGMDQHKLTITVYDKPSAPGKPEVSDITPSTLTLTWEPPTSDGGSPITSYIIERCDVTTNTWTVLTTSNKTTTYSVKNLAPDTQYVFRVSAENVVGVSEPSPESDIVNTLKKPEPEVAAEKVAEPQEALKAPYFIDQLKDKDATDGDPVQFVCKVTGKPLPVITWYRNDELIKPSQDFKQTYTNEIAVLDIVEVFPDDAGRYTCKAVNPAGDAVTRAKLRVEELPEESPPAVEEFEAPKIVEKFKDLELIEGKTARLECLVTGKPEPEVTWYKDDCEIKNSRHIYAKRDGNKCTLIIANVNLDDDAEYTCRAKNPVGKTECAAEVLIETPEEAAAEFLIKPKKVETVQAEIPIDPDKPKEPPFFIQEPVKTTSIEGEPAEFRCKVGGYPPPKVTWNKGWRQLTDGREFTLKYDEETEEHVLIVKETRSNSSGKYTVKIENEVGADKTNVPLLVEVKPEEEPQYTQVLKRRPSEIARMEAEEIDINELLKDVDPKDYEKVLLEHGIHDFRVILKHIEWLKQQGDKELDLPKLKGWEEVLAEETIAAPVKLQEVHADRPQVMALARETIPEDSEVPTFAFAKPLKDVEVVEKDTAQLVCEVTDERAEVTWMKDGQIIEPGDERFIIEKVGRRCSLVVKDTTILDEAEYTCQLGELQTTAELLVEEVEPIKTKVTIVDGIETKEATAEQTVMFECVVSDETGKATWFKDGDEIEPSEKYEIKVEGRRRSLTIHNISSDDEADYTCTVDEDKTAAELFYKEPVKIIKSLTDQTVKEHLTATYECEFSLPIQKHEVKFFLNNELLKETSNVIIKVSGTKATIVMKDVVDKDEGEISVKVRNATSTAKMNVELPPFEISKGLHDASAEEKQTGTFQCQVSDQRAKVTWLKNGEPITLDETKYTSVSQGKIRKLVISDLAFDDKAEYSVMLQDQKSTATLDVEPAKIAPFFIEKPKFADVVEDSPAEFRCKVGGYPTPVISWSKGWKQCTECDEYTITYNEETEEHTMIINKTTIKDAGKYTVKAVNEMGEQKVPVSLMVQEKPAEEPQFMKKLKRRPSQVKVETKPEDIDIEELLAGVPVKDYELVLRKHGIHDFRVILQHIEMMKKKKIEEEIKPIVEPEVEVVKAEIETVSAAPQLTVAVKTEEVVYNFVKDLEDVEVVENEAVELTCEVSDEKAEVSWLKDGVEIKPDDDKYEFKSSGRRRSLCLKSATVKDEAEYTCVVGDTSTTAELFVEDKVQPIPEIEEVTVVCAPVTSLEEATIAPVKFLYKLKDTDVEENQTARLDCEINQDVSDDDISWSKDDEQLLPGDKYEMLKAKRKVSLIIHDVSFEDEGDYTVSVGSSTSTAGLFVSEAPKFATPLQDKEIPEKESIELTCEVTKPNVKVNWYKDDEQISPYDHHYKIKTDGRRHSLVIDDVKLKDEAKYTAKLGDIETAAELVVEEIVEDIVEEPVICSAVASLQQPTQLEEAKIELAKPIEDKEVDEFTESVSFSCQLTRPTNDVTWLKDDQPIDESDKYKIVKEDTSHTLIVSDVTTEDEGIYTFKAGDVKTDAELLVELTKFGEQLKDIQCSEFEPVTLECEVTNKLASVTWLKDQEEVKESPRVKISTDGTKHMLTILETIPEDEAEYTCKVGAVTTSCELLVDTTTFTSTLADKDVSEFEKSTFECEVSNEKANVTWLKDGQPIEEGPKYTITVDGKKRTLLVHDITPDDDAEYTCVVGDHKTTCGLFVEATKFSSPLKSTDAIEFESVTLECEVSHDKGQVTWFKNGKEIEPSDKYRIEVDGQTRRLIISDLTCEDVAEYTCVIGTEKTSTTLNVKATGFSSQLKDVDATEFEATVLECELSHEKGVITWLKDGKPIEEGPKYTFIVDGKKRALKIEDVSPDDDAEYTCVVGDEKTTAGVFVEDTSFTTKLNDSDALEFESVTLECVVSHERAHVVWLVNDVELQPSEKYEFVAIGKTRKLIIHDLSISDDAEYTCVFGKEMTTAAVTVETTKFTTKLSDIDATEFESATYECEVSHEKGEVIWLKDGKPIEESPKYKIIVDGKKRALIIQDVSVDDDAEYTCVMRDEKTSANTFVEATTFTSPIKDIDAIEYENEKLECVVSHEKATVTWLKDGQPIEEGPKYTFVADGKKRSLLINDVNPDDDAEYTCVIGEEKCTAGLFVCATKFTKELKDVDVIERETARFDVEVSHEKAEVTWLKDGKEIEPSMRYEYKVDGKQRSLIIHGVTPDDEAEYTCVLGKEKSNGGLFVEPPPVEFVVPVKPVDVIERQTAAFECEISEDAEVTWQKDGEDIQPSEKYEYISEGKIRKLVIHNCNFEEEAEYTCVTKDHKSNAELVVLEAAPEFKEPLKDVTTMEESDSCTLQCTLDKITTNVKWMKNKEVITESAKYEFVHDEYTHKLIVKDNVLEDDAEYTCVVGEYTSEANIKVEEKPVEIVEGLKEVVASPDDTISFTCVLNKERVNVKWFKNDEEIKPSDKYEMTKDFKTHKLVVKNAVFEDDAEFSFVAESEASRADLIVEDEPKVTVEPKFMEITVKAETKIVVESSFTGAPAPESEWTKDGNKLDVTDDRIKVQATKAMRGNTTLTINKAKRSDKATYTVTVSNDLGTDSVNVVVNVLDKPTPPTNLKISEITPETVTLNWEPPEDDGGDVVTEYTIEKRDTKRATWSDAGTTSDLTFQVKKLIEGNEYVFRVSAVNKHGTSEPTQTSPIIAKHQFDVPMPPTKPEISDVDRTVMTVTWSPPEFDGGSPVTGYFVERCDTARDRYIRVNKDSITETSLIVHDLVEGNEYVFKIYAQNEAGPSKPSPASDPRIAKPPYDAPEAPGKPETENIERTEMKVSWTPPENDGGSPITGYIVEKCDVARDRWVKAHKETVLETELLVKDLMEGNTYKFRVFAENAAGLGPASKPSEPRIAKPPYDPPSAPGKPETSDVDATVMTVTWTTPETDGGSPITSYIIERRDTFSTRWVKVNKDIVLDNSYKVTNLVEGTEYQFQIMAENKAGVGPASEPSDLRKAKPPYDPPNAPGKPDITAVDSTEITITWTPPENDGGSPITGYTIERCDISRKRWITCNKQTVTETTFTITELIEGNEYQFRVAAENKAGVGDMSEPSDVTKAKPPYDVPTAPGKPEVTGTMPTYITITWAVPESDGGSPITNYVIEKRDTTRDRWVKGSKEVITDTVFSVPDLLEGNEYEFRVAAENKAGIGAFSEPSDKAVAKLPYDVPEAAGKPEVLNADATEMTIEWTPPEKDGGSPVIGYVIEKQKDGGRWLKVNKDIVPELTYTVQELVEGSEYRFRVSAQNAAGVGKPSEPSDPRIAKPPYDVPTAPGKPETSDVDKTEMTITWTPPLSDGGSEIFNYIIEKRETNVTRWVKATKVTITECTYKLTDLKEGLKYEFRVSAENKAGVGPVSPPSDPRIAKPPYDPPSAPGKPKITDIDSNHMTLTWTVPDNDGGSEIIGYVIEKCDTNRDRWLRVNKELVKELTLTVTDLIEGNEYIFRVAAENKAGLGNYSEPSDPKVAKPPYDLPEAPGKPEVENLDKTSMNLTWAPPKSDGGSAIFNYVIERKETSSSRWVKIHKDTWVSTEFTVLDLIEGNEYEFRVAAENKAGVGNYSEPSDPRIAKPPYDVPGPPSKPILGEIDRTVMTVTWTPPESDGGSPIIGYFVEKKEQFSSRWTKVTDIVVSELTLKVSNLTEGSLYQFRVSANNKAGTGTPSEPTEPTMAKPPYDPPEPPSRPEVSDVTAETMHLTWNPPDNDGGSPITGYFIEKRDVTRDRWSKVNKDAVKNPKLTVENLTEGTTYEFRVSAKNDAGVGNPSEPSVPTKAKPPYDIPESPGKPDVTDVTASTMTLTWAAPVSDGGSPITTYVIESKDSFSTRWNNITKDKITDLTYTVSGLMEGSEYQFRIKAQNAAGLSKPSQPSDPVIAKPPFVVPGAPSKPVISDVTAMSMKLTWNAPGSDGGSPITGYSVEARERLGTWTVITLDAVQETSYTATSLIEGKVYEFRVSAQNKAGLSKPSPPSDPTEAKDPIDPPCPPGKPEPTNISGTEMKVTWSMPENDGGSPIIGYIVERCETARMRWMKSNTDLVKETTYLVQDLIEGNTYTFRIIAVNKAGESEPSEPSEPKVAKPPYDVPEPPSKPNISDVDATQMTLTWTPPEHDGGSPVTGYIIERKDSMSIKWVKAVRDVVTDTTITVKGLIEGTEYQFHVAAQNKAGTGKFGEPSDPRIAKPPYDIPGPPGMPSVTSADSTWMTLTWSPPEDDGGAEITNYIVEMKEGFSTTWKKVVRNVSDTTHTVKNLTEGNEYEFRVSAENKAGVGPPSEPSTPRVAKPPYDVPGPPGKPDVTETDKTMMTITWTPPEEDGGSPLTGYVIEKCDISRDRWTKANRITVTESTFQVTDLIEGQKYIFRVSGENKAGVGKPSEPSEPRIAKLPYDVPDAPGQPEVSKVDSTAMTLTWAAPDNDGGSPVTGYVIEKKDVTSTRWVRVNKDIEIDTTLRVTQLIEGTTYEFRVSAQNKAGVGKPSEPSKPQKAKPPYGKIENLLACLLYLHGE